MKRTKTMRRKSKMALENINESVDLAGESIVNETVVVSFSCRIAENGIAGSTTQFIRDYGLYQQHRTVVRQDLQAFQTKIWEIEDRLGVTVQ